MNLDVSEVLGILDEVLRKRKISINEEWVITEGPTPIDNPVKYRGGKGGGGFEIDGQPILVYIYNQTYNKRYGKDPVNNVADRRKVHLTACQTITGKKKDKRYDEQYVWIRRGDGKFPAKFIIDNHEGPEALYELLPCQHCLGTLGLQMSDFSFGKYLAGNLGSKSASKPLNTPITMPEVGNYTPNWSKKSRKTKEDKNYTCEICGCCYAEHPDKNSLIEVHHINGRKGDNRPSNLQVLCCPCHRKQPGHNY